MDTNLSGVVGIGYSAGGLEPCLELISNLDSPCGSAFVILPHLSRQHTSRLPSIIQRRTAMPVSPITHGQRLQPGHVYVLTPNNWVVLRGEVLWSIPRPVQRLNCCITVFFKSLAAELGSRATGVILSGAAVGNEGYTGIQYIKRRGGRTMAQLPSTADFPDMPKQAMASGRVDLLLSPADLGRELSRCRDFLGRAPAHSTVNP